MLKSYSTQVEAGLTGFGYAGMDPRGGAPG